jgi:hypothetical protein
MKLVGQSKFIQNRVYFGPVESISTSFFNKSISVANLAEDTFLIYWKGDQVLYWTVRKNGWVK